MHLVYGVLIFVPTETDYCNYGVVTCVLAKAATIPAETIKFK